MRWLVLSVTLMALVGLPSVVASRDVSRVKMVTTSFAGKITSRYGHQLRPKDGVIKLRLFQFFGNTWPRPHWATIVCVPDESGKFRSSALIPVDPESIAKVKSVTRGRNQIPNRLGFLVLDSQDQPLHLPDGIRIEFNQIGKDAWPTETVLIVQGNTDDAGFIWDTAMFPVNNITINNLTEMSVGRGE